VRRPGSATLAYGLFGLTMAQATLAVGGAVVVGMSFADAVDAYLVTNVAMGVAFPLCGVLIARHRPRNPIGWLFLLFGVAHLTTAAVTPLAWHGVEHGWPMGLLRLLVTLFMISWPFGIGMLLPLALQLFPDGRPVSPGWRPLRWFTIAAGACFVAWFGTAPESFIGVGQATVRSYLAYPPSWVSDLLAAAANPAMLVVYLAVVASLVTRYVRGDDRTRRQLLWLVLALIAIVVINWQRWLLADMSSEGILLLLALPLVPIAVTVAILRYELFDIRLVVSRTVLYGTLIGVVIASYTLLVAVLDGLLRGIGAPVLATLLIALAFNPARVRLQRLVDRAFYGAGRDPVTAVATLGDRLAADDLTGVLAGIREALRLPFAALRDGSREVAASGIPPAALHTVALTYRGQRVGDLVVGARQGERRLAARDLSVLDLLATPLAVAMHATALSEALQTSRAKLVTAAEEERRRLHRDLHDSLGPTLTGAALTADAVANLIDVDPARAREINAELRERIGGAISDVRRLVYGLRPPALDELGLVGALERYAAQLDSGLQTTVRCDEALPELPAAVEVAAYRIATEALTNVVRHAGARRAVVSVEPSGASLRLRVCDDGRNGEPAAGWLPGFGIQSMGERAAEVGGWCEAGPTETGGRVLAVLPLGGTR
jgi:two-component system, NarL family, sensor kinase